MLRPAIHLLLHFLISWVIAKIFYKDSVKKSWLIMISTMVIDLDHLLATPVFSPGRCSIGFHPMHTYFAIALYLLLSGFNKTRLVGFGLMIHIGLDLFDCFCMWVKNG